MRACTWTLSGGQKGMGICSLLLPFIVGAQELRLLPGAGLGLYLLLKCLPSMQPGQTD